MPLLLRALVGLSFLFGVAASSSASCNTAEFLSALQPLRSDASYNTCQVDAQAAAICVSAACQSLMAPLAALDLPLCQLSLKGVAFNTAALRSLSSASCQQQQQQQSTASAANMLWTILQLMR
ncbi:elicitin-like protein SOL12 [Phytophthora cinnamomi]|uniref:elicitin-like protein SOL12 n=1 Tax=Phytophthora cinnamomi TaxID=4785 RepID=UPI00355A06A8|nr:elicitin-like protein SOL12 [Phytophthora cinnamomi]